MLVRPALASPLPWIYYARPDEASSYALTYERLTDTELALFFFFSSRFNCRPFWRHGGGGQAVARCLEAFYIVGYCL